MRKLGAVFLIGAACAAGCRNFRICEDSWWGPDKIQHFAVSAAIGAGGAALAATRTDKPEAAFAAGAMAAVTVGTAKEWTDLYLRKTCWSWRDWVWDCLGASAGASLAWTLEINSTPFRPLAIGCK